MNGTTSAPRSLDRMPGEAVGPSVVLQLRLIRRSPAVVVLAVVQPAVFAFVALQVAAQHPAPSTITEIVLGSALVGMWAGTVWGASMIVRRDVREGTLATVVLMGCRIGPIVSVRLLATILLLGISALITALSVVLLAGYVPAGLPYGCSSLSALVALATMVASGLLISPLFVLSRAANRISEALTYPIFIAAGLFLPAGERADALGWFPDLVPATWAARAARECLHAGSVSTTILVGALTTSALTLLAALVLARFTLNKSRSEGVGGEF